MGLFQLYWGWFFAACWWYDENILLFWIKRLFLYWRKILEWRFFNRILPHAIHQKWSTFHVWEPNLNIGMTWELFWYQSSRESLYARISRLVWTRENLIMAIIHVWYKDTNVINDCKKMMESILNCVQMLIRSNGCHIMY